MRRAKIVVTPGPASTDPDTITRMLDAGMDVARLNFSHGSHDTHARTIAMLREAARNTDCPLAILQDLQGPKIRTGTLQDGQPVLLEVGARFVITTRQQPGTADCVSTTYEPLPHDVQRGDRILLSDGLIELRVIGTTDDEVQTEVVTGGELREKQGINLPGVNISAPSLTPKDAADLWFGLSQDVDYIALSFVRRAADIVDIKQRIAAAGKDVPVIAKIEKPEALDDLTAILKHADGIMVARGDLGVEMPTEQVPPVQKQLIDAANDAGLPVITATQMLDSMMRNPRPTRAEASDVANAIIDGTDAVMLSGETAAGLYPVESVKTMAKIIEAAEASGRRTDHAIDLTIKPHHEIPHAISEAASAIVNALDVEAIVAFTLSGNTARLISHQRPTVPILAFTPSETIYRRLNLLWGVTPILDSYMDSLGTLCQSAFETLLVRGFAKHGDTVVVIGGYPLSSQGKTNFINVVQVNPLDHSDGVMCSGG